MMMDLEKRRSCCSLVERGAQLVAQVGQKLALVLAGLPDLAGLLGQFQPGGRQLLKLGIGLLQLHLRLRLLQDAALLFQLFVVDAQLLLLYLQFLDWRWAAARCGQWPPQ